MRIVSPEPEGNGEAVAMKPASSPLALAEPAAVLPNLASDS